MLKIDKTQTSGKLVVKNNNKLLEAKYYEYKYCLSNSTHLIQARRH